MDLFVQNYTKERIMKKNLLIALLVIAGGVNAIASYQVEEAVFRLKYDFEYRQRLQIGNSSIDRKAYKSYNSELLENDSIKVLATVHSKAPVAFLAEKTKQEIRSKFCGQQKPIMDLIEDRHKLDHSEWELVSLFDKEQVLGKPISIEVLVPTNNRIIDFKFFSARVYCQE
tara:strand:+ start:22934 stop:23446 length:513 start_codon:yes stop_codon:yes gene_type:complete